MAKVLGVGGVFYKAANPADSSAWYKTVLGMDMYDWGGAFFTPDAAAAHPGAGTVFSPFKESTDYFQPSTRELMINFMVDDLDGVLARCKEHGVEPIKLMPDEVNGRFAHIMGPDGLKIELWQPKPMAGA
jgi:predicted enzyme related to lactoylglutathione lyase